MSARTFYLSFATKTIPAQFRALTKTMKQAKKETYRMIKNPGPKMKVFSVRREK